jgi:chorismate synthase
VEELQAFMERRRGGKNAFSTKRSEEDRPEFLSGLVDDITCGMPLCAVIKNGDKRSSDYAELLDKPRPGHADYTAFVKWKGNADMRGGGHFSGRLTAPMCIAGGICLQMLARKGIDVCAHILSVVDVSDEGFDLTNPASADFGAIKAKKFATISPSAEEKMRAIIEDARLDGDSVGGVIECAATGLPAGLGEHMFLGVEGRISSIIFGIPAVKGIEFGLGFGSASLRGSRNNDPFYTDGEKIYTKTTNAGGILGGMSSGMPIIFRAAMKPTPSIFKEQDSVDITAMTNKKLTIHGRHDPCVAVRAVPVFEAAAAIATLDLLLDNNLENR